MYCIQCVSDGRVDGMSSSSPVLLLGNFSHQYTYLSHSAAAPTHVSSWTATAAAASTSSGRMDGALKTVVMMGDEFMRREKSFSKRRRQRGPSFSRPIIGKSLNGFMSLSHHGHQLEGGVRKWKVVRDVVVGIHSVTKFLNDVTLGHGKWIWDQIRIVDERYKSFRGSISIYTYLWLSHPRRRRPCNAHPLALDGVLLQTCTEWDKKMLLIYFLFQRALPSLVVALGPTTQPNMPRDDTRRLFWINLIRRLNSRMTLMNLQADLSPFCSTPPTHI